MSSAERTRRYRARQVAGLIVLRSLAVDHVTIAEALVAHGLLAPADYDKPEAIAAALERAEIKITGPRCDAVTTWLRET